jgi:hypothetical protein
MVCVFAAITLDERRRVERGVSSWRGRELFPAPKFRFKSQVSQDGYPPENKKANNGVKKRVKNGIFPPKGF